MRQISRKRNYRRENRRRFRRRLLQVPMVRCSHGFEYSSLWGIVGRHKNRSHCGTLFQRIPCWTRPQQVSPSKNQQPRKIKPFHRNKKLEDAYNVSLGIYNRCQKEKTQKTFFIRKVHVHEKYKDNIPYYDVAVLILKESTNTYEPICLPKSRK